MQLKGKKVFITGGTGGIGRPLVRFLRDAGAVVTVYDRKTQGDLSSQLEPVCMRLSLDTPDILINLAGYNDFNHCELQDAENLLRVNLVVPIRLTQAVLPNMKQRRSGQIVNVGSMTALIPLPHLTCYVAGKAGLKGFSDALRREIEGSGVVVTHITPRAVNTDANKGLKKILNERIGVRSDSADDVARRILKAIVKDQSDVRIGWPERIFAILNAVFPRIVDAGLIKNRDIGNEILNQNASLMQAGNERKQNMKKIITLAVCLLAAAPVQAQEQVLRDPTPAVQTAALDPVMEKISDIQTRWAEIKYHGTDKDTQISEMAALAAEAAEVSAANPERPEARIWQAIVLSSEAGLVKGLSALPKVKAAKTLLESAAQVDPHALQGSAYTSLGSLYYQVPGWPIAFGDTKKAEKYLRAALDINPDGIDPNFFYGDFLVHEKRYDEAIPILEKALTAPDRPGRALADEGRRQEIRSALATARKESAVKTAKFN